MLYRENVIPVTVKMLVDLFDPNDKSKLTIIKEFNNATVFSDRVDYLQYNSEGEMDSLCSLQVKSLDQGKDSLLIYV